MPSLMQCFFAAMLCAATLQAAAAPLAAGDTPPDYAGKTAQGALVSLSDYKGKAVVLSFWATWCQYCMKELPVLEAIQRKASAHLQVVAINTEELDTFRRVTRALSQFQLQHAYDPNQRAATAYGVKGIPHLVIIGRDGKIRAVHRGYGESSLEAIVADVNLAIGSVN